MGLFTSLRNVSAVIFLSSLALVSASTQATTVQFQTVMGNIEVNLFDKTTPETVKNFLHYLNAGSYTNSVIHRSAKVTENKVVRSFVVQGGGFIYNGTMPLIAVKTKNPVINEPLYSNVRGTIAMAKLANSPNSATSGWFFNMGNNAFLDTSNGGFTVFGQVTEASLPVLDAIAAVNTFYAGFAELPEFPIRDYTVEDYQNNEPVDDTNLVIVTDIVILNPSADTADSLTPTPNPNYKPPVDETNNEGGGSVTLWHLGVLFLLTFVMGCSRIRKSL